MGSDKNDGKESKPSCEFPLERYLKESPRRECKIDFSKLDGIPLTKDDIKALHKITETIKSAEVEMSRIASTSKTSTKESQTVYINEPDYFDKDFDEKKYIKDLVTARINGMKVVERPSAVSKVRKNYYVSTKRDDSVVQKTATSGKTNVNINKTADTYKHKSTDKNESKTLKKTNIDSVEIKGDDQVDKISIKLPSKSLTVNSKYFEIKSSYNEDIEIEEPLSHRQRLTVQAMPGVNIRTQLIEQKILSLDIFPDDGDKIQAERAKNVYYVHTKHCENNVLKKKKVKIVDATSISDAASLSGISEEQTKSKSFKKGYKSETKIQDTSIPHKFIMDKRENAGRDGMNFDSMQHDDSFIFLNNSEGNTLSKDFKCDHSKPTNKKISMLKKFGIPEIQKIYNPKGLNLKKTSSYSSTSNKSTNRNMKSSRESNSQFPLYSTHASSSNAYSHNSGYEYRLKGSSNVTDAIIPSAVYIPYSKLTVGGYNPDITGKNTQSNIQSRSVNAKQSIVTTSEPYKHQAMTDVHKGKFLSDDSEEEKRLSSDEELHSEAKSTSEKNYEKRISKISEHSIEDTKSHKPIDKIIDLASKANSSDDKSLVDYVDDFDDEDSKSQYSDDESKSQMSLETSKIDNINDNESVSDKNECDKVKTMIKKGSIKENNKSPILKMKKKVDVFDFFHYVETKDDATQSCNQLMSDFKETQTSPRSISKDKDTKTVCNDDLKILEGEEEKFTSNINSKVNIGTLTLEDMLKIQKGLSFIDSYMNYSNLKSQHEASGNSHLTNDKINLVSRGEEAKRDDNVICIPKNTQTSPSKTVHMMTSPAKLIHRNLSPMFNDFKIDAQTSPENNNYPLPSQAVQNEFQNVSIAIPHSPNVNSPIPLKSSEEKRNMGKSSAGVSHNKLKDKKRDPQKDYNGIKESSEVYSDFSESSETHSLGEINLKYFKRKSVLIKRQSTSNSTSTSFTTSSSSDFHFDSMAGVKKSDGEISVGQILDKK